MASLDHAELSALEAQVAELAARVAAIGEQVQGGLDADAAGPLFEAERSLRMAARSLDRARGTMGFRPNQGDR